MSEPHPLTPQEQFQALNILEYLSDLFTAANKETFSRGEVLVILSNIKSDPDFFEPEVQAAHEQVMQELAQEVE